MSSALACVGPAVSDEASFSWLLKSAYTAIREIGTFDGVHVGRRQDDSGTALILGLHDGKIVDFATTGVAIYSHPAACTASPDSHIPGTAPEPPPDYTGPWPPRLAGTVLDATRHVCALTGQPFTVAAVRTAGFTAGLCLAAGDHSEMPEPGSIISGTVVLPAATGSPLLNAAQA